MLQNRASLSNRGRNRDRKPSLKTGQILPVWAVRLTILIEDGLCLWRAGRKARGHRVFFSPATAAAMPLLLARSFSLSPPTAPLELNARVVYSDASFHTLYLHTSGSAWSQWEPAALRSSPAHPRSWQAPSCFLAEPESAYVLCPLYICCLNYLL